MTVVQAEKMTRDFVAALVRDYGAAGALTRAKRMRHNRAYRHDPLWLRRAIEILEAQQ